ncbi:MAG: HAD-IB family hydrolase [Microthrixaceae bacterium]
MNSGEPEHDTPAPSSEDLDVSGPVRKVAVFDFDGTITRRDTLVPFLYRAAGPARLAAAVIGASPRLVAGLRSPRHRDTAKEVVLRSLLRGRVAEEMREHGRRYAADLPRLFRRDTLDAIEQRRADGADLVIVSASIDFYLRPIAADLGIDHLICVTMEEGSDGRLTGTLVGTNVRKGEKAVRLRAWLDETTPAGTSVELWAYGDSDGDSELLAMADHPRWVGRRSRRA